MEVILDLLLPATDAGVAAQLVVVFVVVAIALWRFWSNLEIRLLVVGSGIVLVGLMGLRALH